MRTFRFAACALLLTLATFAACDSAPTAPQQRTSAPVALPLQNTSTATKDTTPTPSTLFCGGGANGGGHRTDTTTVCAQ